jgi:hypothetical protein
VRRCGLTRRRWLQTALAAGAACALPALPALAQGGVGFGALDLDWVDTARQRAVPVRLVLPHQGERLPLVVFSHGMGGSRAGYRWLGEHLASQGVASLHVQHVGSDRRLWSGNVLSVVSRLQEAAQDQEAIARVHDLRFALDTLLVGDLAARVDARRIVAAGHSYGANTTLLACGARVQRHGQVLDLQDTRVRAAIVISRCSTPLAARASGWRCLKAARTACSPTVPAVAAQRSTRRSSWPRVNWPWPLCAGCSMATNPPSQPGPASMRVSSLALPR